MIWEWDWPVWNSRMIARGAMSSLGTRLALVHDYWLVALSGVLVSQAHGKAAQCQLKENSCCTRPLKTSSSPSDSHPWTSPHYFCNTHTYRLQHIRSFGGGHWGSTIQYYIPSSIIYNIFGLLGEATGGLQLFSQTTLPLCRVLSLSDRIGTVLIHSVKPELTE